MSSKMIFLLIFIYIFLQILIKKKRIVLNEREKFFSEITKLGIIVFLLLLIKIGGHVPLRISLYFFMIFPVYFSEIFIKIKLCRYLKILFLICCFLFASMNLFRNSYREYNNLNLRKSWYFKNILFNDYKDLSGKVTPHGEVDFKYEER